MGSRWIVIMDSGFGNFHLTRGLWTNGLHEILMIKTRHGGYPKKELVSLLEDKERGAHITAMCDIDGEQYMAVAWHGKSDQVRGRKWKENYMSMILATDCSTTTPRTPAEMKCHDRGGNQAPSLFIQHPKVVEQYFGSRASGTGMSAIDQNNKLHQHCLGIEEAVRTNDPWK